MTLKTICIMLTLGFSSLGLLTAQQRDEIETDTAELSVDSLWRFDSSFGDQLAIPSYEELLELYFEAVVAVDKHLNFNPYRFQPGNTEQVNPFVYKDIVLPEGRESNLEDYLDASESQGSFEQTADEVLLESRTQLAQDNPALITTTWKMLPDPPKTERQVNIIHNVSLDLSQINKQSRRINGPEKLEKERYVYEPWQMKVVSSLNASQTAFSNWGKGGSNSFSVSGRVVADADYVSFDKKVRWENNIESRLGYMQQEQDPFVKNLDFFRINTQYARIAFNKWYYAVNAEFTSQFFEGFNINKGNYDDPISAFLAPAYIKIALGLDYKFGTDKNKKLLSLQASPLSYKMTYVRDTANIDQNKYGVEDNKTNRQEIGGSVQLSTEYTYNKKIGGTSRLLFFSNYMDNPQNVDINWNTSITYHISRIFAVSFTLDMIYDDDVDILLSEADDGTKIYGQRIQFKEYLGFGLTYRFM